MEVHGDVRARERAVKAPLEAGGVDDGVDERSPARRIGQLEERPEGAGCGQQSLVLGKRPSQTTQRGDGRQQGPEPQRPKHDGLRAWGYGQDVSVEGQTTSSRISTPAGRVKANTTVSATSEGGANLKSGGGL